MSSGRSAAGLSALGVWLGFAWLVGACAGDNTLEPCDIRETSCQFDVFMAVQDVRGSIWDPWLEPPPMRVISEASYRAEVIAAREQAIRDRGPDYLTPALKLLRMIDPNELPDADADFMVGSVVAYYSTLTHVVTIIDRGVKADHRADVQTLAHELVHAAQDRDVGISRLYAPVHSTDSANALNALVEGEADMYALLVDAKQREIPKKQIDWRILSDWAGDLRVKVFGSDSPFRPANQELPYPLGALYVSGAYVEGGPLAVRTLFDQPPLSAARYMSGRGRPGDVPQPPWVCAVPAAPSGYELRVSEELGALSLYAFMTRFSAGESTAWSLANLWRGDRFFVYTRPENDAELAVVWQVRCPEPTSAETLRSAIAVAPWAGAVQTAVQGDSVYLFSASSELVGTYDAWTRCAGE
jgi:hypothetical protein